MKKWLVIIISFLMLTVQSFATVDETEQTITYNCDGNTVEFDFTFNVGDPDDIKVVLTDSSGTETTLTVTTHYSVSCTATNWDTGLNPIEWDCTQGGTVTTVDTYASGNTITITTDIAITQETEYTENMPALYQNFENSLDKLTRICKQLQEEIDSVSTTSASTFETFTLPSTSGDYVAEARPLYAEANQSTTLGQVCYMASDGDFTLAKGNAYATAQGNLGIATEAIGSTEYGTFLQQGYICNTSWAWSTIGAPLFISPATAGAMTETEPSAGEYARVVGFVVSSTVIRFCPTASPVIKKKAE